MRVPNSAGLLLVQKSARDKYQAGNTCSRNISSGSSTSRSIIMDTSISIRISDRSRIRISISTTTSNSISAIISIRVSTIVFYY